MSGLFAANDKGNVLISSDTESLTFSHIIHHDFYQNNVSVPLGNEDGTFSVWYRGDTTSLLYRIGIFQAMYSSPMYVGRYQGNVQPQNTEVDQYIFTSNPTPSSGLGLQLFNANGVETYNSEKALLSIIDKVSIRVADSYDKPVKRNSDGSLYIDATYWSKSYTGYTKLGLLFTNAPGGVAKTSSIYQVWAYEYNFRTAGNKIELEYRPAYFSYSQSSAVIDLDTELRLEFFVIDLSNVA